MTGLYTLSLVIRSLLIYRRCTGGIKLSSDTPEVLANTAGASLIGGPWRIPRVVGIVNNAFTCTHLTIILLFSVWPPVGPTTAQIMNSSSLVLEAMVLFNVGYHIFYARKEYMGRSWRLRIRSKVVR